MNRIIRLQQLMNKLVGPMHSNRVDKKELDAYEEVVFKEYGIKLTKDYLAFLEDTILELYLKHAKTLVVLLIVVLTFSLMTW